MAARTTDISADRPGWTGRLWADIAGTYDSIIAHPFITGLTDGELAREAFLHFIAQDELYIREYSRALGVLASKAPTWEATALISKHAASAVASESQMHDALVADAGKSLEELTAGQPLPTTAAYCDFVRFTTLSGSFAEGLCAIMPCFWIYGVVGQHLAQRGSPVPMYQKWIDGYDNDEYLSAVVDHLELMDRLGEQIGAAEQARARQVFVSAARYEWMFWDAAWKQEDWPIPVS